MAAVTDITARIADIDALLWEQDDVLIDRALATGEAPDHGRVGDVPCRWCDHDWHGLPCEPAESLWDIVIGGHCTCEGAMTARGDEWRPVLYGSAQDRLSQHIHDTGLDGWAAQADLQRGPLARILRGPIFYERTFQADHTFHVHFAGPSPVAQLTADGYQTLGMLDPADGITFYNADAEIPPPPAPSVMAQLGGMTVTWEDYGRHLAEAFNAATVSLSETFERFRTHVLPAVEHLHHEFACVMRAPGGRPTPLDRELRDTDPRAYALQLRQTRGTGPNRDVVRQHRPRRHR